MVNENLADAMTKNKIFFVPGKNPKPAPVQHLPLIRRCLLRGVELARPEVAREMAADPSVLSLIPWNALFYGFARPIDEDLPWIEGLIARTGPDASDIAEALNQRSRRARWLYVIADLFPWLIPFLPDPAVRSAVHETGLYFHNRDNIACEVRELLKAPLRNALANGERVLLIGHSMGSIIAYDSLWELTHVEGVEGRVDLFLSLGSPLGMNFTQIHLLGFRQNHAQRFPGCLRRWVNIAAQGDLTALDPEVADDFSEMVRRGLIESITDEHDDVFNYFRNQNGLNFHRSYGYLVQPRVGAVIADWWRGA
jgi:hypothetical protein